jgi:hypothetical protein
MKRQVHLIGPGRTPERQRGRLKSNQGGRRRLGKVDGDE